MKKLITTCYKNCDANLFSSSECEQAIWLEYTGDKNGNRIPDLEEIGIRCLKGDGDFRSVVKNPIFKNIQLFEYSRNLIAGCFRQTPAFYAQAHCLPDFLLVQVGKFNSGLGYVSQPCLVSSRLRRSSLYLLCGIVDVTLSTRM